MKTNQPITVEIIQAMLQAQGLYHGEIDNDWGPQTQPAMDSFQRKQGAMPPPWLLVAERELGMHEVGFAVFYQRKHNRAPRRKSIRPSFRPHHDHRTPAHISLAGPTNANAVDPTTWVLTWDS